MQTPVDPPEEDQQHDRNADARQCTGCPPEHGRGSQCRNKGRKHRGHGLQHKHRSRIKCSNNRALAQPGQPPQRARRKIGPGRPQQLKIGRRDAPLHRRPDQI
jgi:hypothetical protein